MVRTSRKVNQPIVAHLRIDNIGEQLVRNQPDIPGKFVPVGYRETLWGEVCKPKDTFVQVVVQPIESSDRWIMQDIGRGEGKKWDGIAYIGREGSIDIGKNFLVYSIVSKDRLPTNKSSKAKDSLGDENLLR